MSGIGKDDKYLWLEILFQNNPFNVGKNNEALAYIRQNFMEVIIFILKFYNLCKYKCLKFLNTDLSSTTMIYFCN